MTARTTGVVQQYVYNTAANGNTYSGGHSIPEVTPFLAALAIRYDGPGHAHANETSEPKR